MTDQISAIHNNDKSDNNTQIQGPPKNFVSTRHKYAAQNYEEYDLHGEEVIVSGDSLEDINIQE